MSRTSDRPLSQFGKRLEKWISEAGYEDLKGFATAIGLSSSNLARMMRQPIMPRLKTLRKIADALGRNLDEVKAAAYGVEPPPPTKPSAGSSDTVTGADQGSPLETGIVEAQRDPEVDELVATFRRLSRRDKDAVLALVHERAAARLRAPQSRAKKAG